MAFDATYYREKKQKLLEKYMHGKDSTLQGVINILVAFINEKNDIDKELAEITAWEKANEPVAPEFKPEAPDLAPEVETK